jgi:hypothetical protein
MMGLVFSKEQTGEGVPAVTAFFLMMTEQKNRNVQTQKRTLTRVQTY